MVGSHTPYNGLKALTKVMRSLEQTFDLQEATRQIAATVGRQEPPAARYALNQLWEVTLR